MESVKYPQGEISRMVLTPFAFNRSEIGAVFPPSQNHQIIPLSKPTKPTEVDAVFCPAWYSFVVISLNLQGEFYLSHKNDFLISKFRVEILDEDELETPVDDTLFSKDFYKRLLAAALEAGQTRAEWYPPETVIIGPNNSHAIAGPKGFIKHIPTPPSGGRGKSRKIIGSNGEMHERVWNDPVEIKETVALLQQAEAIHKSNKDSEKASDLSTVGKREQWIADTSGIWSVGTVHVQLAIARKEGLIKSGRTKK
jgi:hypothetical protein